MTADPLAEYPRAKAEILARALAAYAAFDGAVARAPEDRLTERGAVGDGWSIKDVLGHTASDDRWFAAQLQAAARGEWPTMADCYGDESQPPPGLDLSTQDGRNTWQYYRNRGVSLDEIRRRSVEARAKLWSVLESLPEDEFALLYSIDGSRLPGRIHRAAGDQEPFASPLWRWVAGNTWHHYEQHAADIEAFLARLDG